MFGVDWNCCRNLRFRWTDGHSFLFLDGPSSWIGDYCAFRIQGKSLFHDFQINYHAGSDGKLHDIYGDLGTFLQLGFHTLNLH